MKNTCFKILAITIAVCFIVSNSGNYLMLLLVKQQARQEVWHQIEDGKFKNAVITISITEKEMQNPENAFKWKDGKREFSYKHNMYDVVSYNVGDGVYSLTCINDSNENIIDGLISIQLEKMIAGESKNTSKSTTPSLKGIEKNYCKTQLDISVYQNSMLLYSPATIIYCDKVATDIFSPPPNFLHI